MTHVPLLDLITQYRSIKDEVDAAVHRVLDTQRFIMGPEVDSLESEIAEYCGCAHAIGVSSGTDALLASLMALDIGPGDEVVTTPFSFFATAGCIIRTGARPVFLDIDPVTFNIDATHLETSITPSTKAIIPVHLFGQCADMDPLLQVAARYDIPVLEDAAQAIGARYKGTQAGAMGLAGCFSFFPSKNLGASGDGGMVTTNDPEFAETIKLLRNHGAKGKYDHEMIGANFRLDAMHAAVLRVKLRYLDTWSAKRQSNAEYYTRRLNEKGVAPDHVICPEIVQERHIFNQYVLRVKNRDALREHLVSRNVASEIYYPIPLHLQDCVSRGTYVKGDLPVSEKAAEEVLALPIYPELTEEQREHVVGSIAEFYGIA